jgi:hypothetical protein
MPEKVKASFANRTKADLSKGKIAFQIAIFCGFHKK